MKYLYFIPLFMFISCQPKHANPKSTEKITFDEAKETEAILAVIKNETKSFFDGNYEVWAKNWCHQDYAMQAWNNSDGTA